VWPLRGDNEALVCVPEVHQKSAQKTRPKTSSFKIIRVIKNIRNSISINELADLLGVICSLANLRCCWENSFGRKPRTEGCMENKVKY